MSGEFGPETDPDGDPHPGAAHVGMQKRRAPRHTTAGRPVEGPASIQFSFQRARKSQLRTAGYGFAAGSGVASAGFFRRGRRGLRPKPRSV